MNILCSDKSQSKMYRTEHRYNDIPDITMRVQRIEREIYPNITILLVRSHRFSLLYLNMEKALKNSTPGKVAYIWRIERFQIDTIKFEGRKFIFFFGGGGGIFSLPSSLVKAPIMPTCHL